VDEILKCDHSNESYWAVLSCGSVYYAIQGGSNFWASGWNPSVATPVKANEQYLPVVLVLMILKMGQTFEAVDEIPKCDYLFKI